MLEATFLTNFGGKTERRILPMCISVEAMDDMSLAIETTESSYRYPPGTWGNLEILKDSYEGNFDGAVDEQKTALSDREFTELLKLYSSADLYDRGMYIGGLINSESKLRGFDGWGAALVDFKVDDTEGGE